MKDGSLSFPVKTQGGTEHDLDELSSGEKEILYGYLRIRSSAPRDSIILLDEPELHLNPRLIRGLPEFYRKHLGEALQNQLWLVTHSDALIREAIGKPGFNVFHMLPCGTDPTPPSQLKPLTISEDLDQVMTDLIGDLAAYRPGGKAVIFEGGGDSDFDKTIVGSLFLEELRGVNLISGTNRARVRALHEVLERAHKKGDIPTKFFAIIDRDSDGESKIYGMNVYSWDTYHIENYLLDSDVISEVLNSLHLEKKFTPLTVRDQLESAARTTVQASVAHRLRAHVNKLLMNCIDLGFSPDSPKASLEMGKAVARSMDRLNTLKGTMLNDEDLTLFEASLKSELDASFADGSWIRVLPGRDILKAFCNAERIKISYEIFRNLIVNRMVETGVKPTGMRTIINAIVDG